jgi:raffinose/stachyose/melibiose transport system permease protein
MPVMLIFLAYTLYPLIDNIRVSFYTMPFFTAGRNIIEFRGLGNYRQIFADSVFHKAVENTFIILGCRLLLSLPLGFLIGLLFMEKHCMSELFKLAMFFPFILSGIISGLLWMFILDPSTGLINSLLKSIGLSGLARQWIGGTVLTPYSVSVVETWGSVGYFGLLFMSGLKMLPKETLEAAVVDGATPLQRTLFITIPMLKETTKIVTTLTIIGSLNTYQTIRILTAGGPNNQSQVLATYIYQTQFGNVLGGSLGPAAAMAVVMLVLVLGMTTLFLSRTRRKVGD